MEAANPTGTQSMQKTVTLVFNYRSPFCALIVDRLFKLNDNGNIRPVWKIAREVPRPSSFPITIDNPRFEYNRQDCERRARWLGLPWNPPNWRLGGMESASRIGQYLLNSGSPAFAPYTLRINRAYWCEGLNTSEADVVRSVALAVGVTGQQLSAVERTAPSLEAELSATQRWCEQQGVLGVPYFIVDNQRFWGSDRFVALLRYLTDIGCGPFSPDLARDLL
jgi:2-hydroxychromene-2-carboxylate isomerase